VTIVVGAVAALTLSGTDVSVPDETKTEEVGRRRSGQAR
jgi:hypothetical protein